MNMRLTDWNASLAHAAELVDKLNQNGCNARAISYSMYDGRKGIAIQLFDRENNFSTEFKTGIFSTYEKRPQRLLSSRYVCPVR